MTQLPNVELEIAPVSPRTDSFVIPINLAPGSKTVYTGAGWLVGWSLRGAAAAAFTLDMFDASDVNGPHLAAAGAVAAAADTAYLGDRGVPIVAGLSITAAGDTVVGAIWVRRIDA